MNNVDIIENIDRDLRKYILTSCSRCGKEKACVPLAIGGGEVKRYYLCGACHADLDVFFKRYL